MSHIIFPLLGAVALLSVWQLYVAIIAVPSYILPSPTNIFRTLIADQAILLPALWITIKTTFLSLLLAMLGGTGVAVIFAQWRWAELFFYPVTVVLQVTPIVAIAPLILIYAPTPFVAQLICAWLVAFFPILSNAVQGLKSAERQQSDLLTTYSASRWQRLRYLQFPSALPYLASGIKIGGGLSLVATVVGEFAAGQAGRNAGLAFRLLEAQSKLNTPRLFAALFLLALLGFAIFAVTSFISWLALHPWHESTQRRGR